MTAEHPKSGSPLRGFAYTGAATAGDSRAGAASSGAPIGSPAGITGSDKSHSGTPREQFSAGELAIVCSHYDLGVIEAVKEYRRGSSRSPKAVLKTSTGLYLLKRRAHGRDNPQRVAFSHQLQAHLAARKFPLPRLIPSRSAGTTLVHVDDKIYELFEFIPSSGYDGSLDATADAGRVLALFHACAADFTPDWSPASASYHKAAGLSETIERLPGALTAHGSRAGRSEAVAQRLATLYLDATRRVERLGIANWPIQIIHGDWHPGNLLFARSAAGTRVAGVLDFDAARPAARAIDIANGALQFSMITGPSPVAGGFSPALGVAPGAAESRTGAPVGVATPEELERWTDNVDEGRLKRFCRGYDSQPGCVISTAELQALPWLMVEALIVEAVVPVAATGTFARMDGLAFLKMIERKAAWLSRRADHIVSLIGE